MVQPSFLPGFHLYIQRPQEPFRRSTTADVPGLFKKDITGEGVKKGFGWYSLGCSLSQ